MSEFVLHRWAVFGQLVLAAITFVALFFVSAAYGRHSRPGWGPTLRARIGWILMESPSCLLFAFIFVLGEHASALVPLTLLALWELHYVQRTFVFPLLMRGSGKPMPVAIVAMGFSFNLLNAYINARWISEFGDYPLAHLRSVSFLTGVAIFLSGFAINVHSDHVLRALRKDASSGYQIPRRGLHVWVASPNYLGEIIEWFGWAIATWSLAGLSFALYTVANLAPRALEHLRWYRKTFPDYPRERRALVPFVW